MARRRRRTKRKKLTPAQWYAQQAEVRKTRFSAFSDADLEQALADLDKERAKKEHEYQLVRDRQLALLDKLRVSTERITALLEEKRRLSKTHCRTGWAGFWSPGLSAEGEHRRQEIELKIKALHEEQLQTAQLPATALRSSSDVGATVHRAYIRETELTRKAITELETQIASHRKELASRNHQRTRDRRLSSKQAAAEEQRRGQLVFKYERVKVAKVRPMLSRDHDCPYCGGTLGEAPHADHIYPVVLGGKSTITNMVMVCAQCNGRKKDQTLREFMRSSGLNRDLVEQRLLHLGKTV